MKPGTVARETVWTTRSECQTGIDLGLSLGAYFATLYVLWPPGEINPIGEGRIGGSVGMAVSRHV